MKYLTDILYFYDTGDCQPFAEIHLNDSACRNGVCVYRTDEQQCDTLSNPDHGRVEVSGYGLQCTAIYACNSDYRRVGDRERTCEEDPDSNSLIWSGCAPMCGKQVFLLYSTILVHANLKPSALIASAHVKRTCNGKYAEKDPYIIMAVALLSRCD